MSSVGRLKAWARTAAPGAAQAWLRLKELAWSARRGDRRYLADLFAGIHRGNLWGEPETVSGPGSSLRETEILRRELPGLLAGLGVRTLLDAPCGDRHWISRTPLDLDLYIGIDVVPALIAQGLSAAAGQDGPRCELRVADITRDPLPRADAILCRDCLIHLSYSYIRRALDNFRRSGATYLLTTNYSGLRENRDILTGQWRPLDLRLPPFGLPEPLRLIIEKDYDEDGRRLQRSLSVWKLAEI
jgi:hypothetical protein